MTEPRELDVDRPPMRVADDSDRRRAHRHPAQVTADRLVDHITDYGEYLSRRDLDAINRVAACLVDIAEGRR